MSIRKRTWNGKEAWQVDLLIRGERIRKQFATKADAKAFELDARNKARQGTYLADGSKFKLRDILDDYRESLAKRLERGARMSAKTVKQQEGHITNYIVGNVVIKYGRRQSKFEKGLGELTFDQISADTIESFCEDLIDFGKAIKTVREIRNTLACILDLARRKKYLTTNPAKGLRLETIAAARKRKIVPPSKALVKALCQVPDPDLAFRVYFSAFTGLRASEQWALRWRHIDFQRGSLTVETKLDALTLTEGATKTDAGNRTVPLSRELLRALVNLREKTRHAADADLIFPGKDGSYIRHDLVLQRFYRAFDSLLERWPAGTQLPSRPRWHDLRHFAISCWIELGLAPKAIQEFAGHASLTMTMDRYGHLFPSPDHRAVMDQVLEGVMAEPGGHSNENGTPMEHEHTGSNQPAE